MHAALVEEIYLAQRERDQAVMARLRLANEERDEALLRAKRLQQAAAEYVQYHTYTLTHTRTHTHTEHSTPLHSYCLSVSYTPVDHLCEGSGHIEHF